MFISIISVTALLASSYLSQVAVEGFGSRGAHLLPNLGLRAPSATFRPNSFEYKLYMTKQQQEDDYDAAVRSATRGGGDDDDEGNRDMASINEENEEFEAKKGEYMDMRSRIRARAASKEIDQSSSTDQLIKAAAKKAAAFSPAESAWADQEDETETTITNNIDGNDNQKQPDPVNDITMDELDLAQIQSDMSAFQAMGSDDPMDDPFGDELAKNLTDEEKAEFDPNGQLPVLERYMSEVKMVKWPGPGTIFRQFVVAILALGGFIALILELDSFLKTTYEQIGLYPNKEDTIQQIEKLGLKKQPTESTTRSMISSPSLPAVDATTTTTDITRATSEPSASSLADNTPTTTFPDDI